MAKADRLDLQMLTIFISRFEILHRFVDISMFLIDWSRTAREHDYIQLFYFLDSRDVALLHLGYLKEKPFLVVVERSKYIRGIVVLEPVNLQDSVRKNANFFLGAGDARQSKDLS